MNRKLDEIHESLVNGQRKQMVDQIDAYGIDFWKDYKFFLIGYALKSKRFGFFTDVVISYHRIKGE